MELNEWFYSYFVFFVPFVVKEIGKKSSTLKKKLSKNLRESIF